MPRISRFSPNWSDPENLEAITVGREELIAGAVDCVRESALTDNKHHLLFIGPRGCGKTHLVTLVHHRVVQMPDLADKLRIAWLNEDETSDTLRSLLLRVHRSLAAEYPSEFPSHSIEPILDLSDPVEATEAITELLLTQLGEHTLLLLIENLDNLFQIFNEDEQKRWRALIQNCPRFCTVATAQRLFQGVSSRDAPFFGFFQVNHLKPFSVTDAITLLARLAQLRKETALAAFIASPDGAARIRALHHLTGGNQRLFIILSDFMDQTSLDSLVNLLEKLVDEQLTSFYQERLRWLPTLQRRIVEYLCANPKPAPVHAIARQLFATSQTVSSQLKELRAIGYLTSKKRGRESLYELAEPLMRLSHQGKEAKGRAPLRLLVDFLRVWYDREELANRFKAIPAAAPITQGYLREALALSQTEGNLRLQYFREDAEGVDITSCDNEQSNVLRDLMHESGDPYDALYYGVALVSQHRYADAVGPFTTALESNTLAPAAASLARLARGLTYGQLGNTDAEINDYTTVINMKGTTPDQVARALACRGVTHAQLGNTHAAISDYTTVINMKDAPPIHVAQALYNRGLTHGQLGNTDAAISDYTTVVELAPQPDTEARSTAHFQLAAARMRSGDWADAYRHLKLAFTSVEPSQPKYVGNVPGYLITIILESGQSAEAWKPRVDQLIAIFAAHNALSELGSGLVLSIEALEESKLSQDGLSAWHELWAGFSVTYPELALPARLLRTGIDYFGSGKNENTLLDLPSEERRLLAQALGLEEQLSFRG